MPRFNKKERMILMEENVNLSSQDLPESEEEGLPSESEATIPAEDQTDSAFVEVKFNKKLLKLTKDEAANLAQKGMKFDVISDEYEGLKELSSSQGLSVSEYISRLKQSEQDRRLAELTEKCSGDEDLAKRLLETETSKVQDELSSLKKEFPELKSEADIPDEVKTAAELKGTGLLFEYLLYEHRQHRAAAEETARQRISAEQSLGSLSAGIDRNAVDAEFLNGIWGR